MDVTTKQKWINGFSKMSKAEKRAWISETYASESLEDLDQLWSQHDHPDAQRQEQFDHFAENTIANFHVPLGIAPNFLIDDKLYAVPMVTEESSVVAAASSAAKYWATRGGFFTDVVSTNKVGQLFFEWQGPSSAIQAKLPMLSEILLQASEEHTCNMRARGGGVRALELVEFPKLLNTFELRGTFETCDSMGANFINTTLECWGRALPAAFDQVGIDTSSDNKPDIIMAILSNYTPECLVRAEVRCPISELSTGEDEAQTAHFVHRFKRAVDIARASPYRATTHNKGIMNGIDAVVIATGNDFRATEAAAHAYAARSGRYRSLSKCSIDDGIFRFRLKIPLALGTVGGLTKAHTLARTNLQLLGNPSANELMRITAAVGLAQNFAAVRSLVTTGIQSGHMRMHLQNMLSQLGATDQQREAAKAHFADKTISFQGVRSFLEKA